MPDLETLLRDVRPAPDPDWAARLDGRVAARFPGPPPRWKAPFIALRENFFVFGGVGAIASVLVVFVVIAVSGEHGSSDDSGGGSSTAAMPAPASSEKSAADSAGDSSESAPRAALPMSAATVAPQSRGRAVQSSAMLTLSTLPAQVGTIADRAIRVVDAAGGYVASSEVNSSGSSANASLVLKIPSARLESGLASLSKLAHVKARSQQAEDLTDQRSALEASVRDARADRAGLRARLAKAATDRERSRLRALLDRATRRVTQRERQVAELGRLVAYATVDLSIIGERRSGAAPPAGRWTPGDALGDAGRVLEVVAGVLVIALAVLAPLAVLALIAALASRLVVRRRRERALEMA